MARRHQTVVLDSSVVVKWFNEEPGSDKAIELMDYYVEGSMELCVSDLLFYEVTNALRYKPNCDAQKLRNAVTQLFKLHLTVVKFDEHLLGRAGEIAYDGGVTLYDAVPVTLAERNRTVCITADEETQYRKLHQKGYPIKLL